MTAPDKAFEGWLLTVDHLRGPSFDYTARLAYHAGRKAMAEEAAALSRQMFNRAADGDEIADAILALIVDNPPAKVVNQQAKG